MRNQFDRQAEQDQVEKIVKSLVVSGVIEFLIWNGLGAEKKVENSKTKPTGKPFFQLTKYIALKELVTLF